MADALPVYLGVRGLTGPAMLSFAGKHILLEDRRIDGAQPRHAINKAWDCASASDMIRNPVGDQEITCKARRVDSFGRVLAVCKAGAVDIDRALVAVGMAVALYKDTADTAPADYREMLAGYLQERRTPAT